MANQKLGGWSWNRGFSGSTLKRTPIEVAFAPEILVRILKRKKLINREKSLKEQKRESIAWNIEIVGIMKGWDGIQSSLSSRSSSSMSHRVPSQSVRLGRVQPQAPSYRTIFCNDRDSNLLVRFKVRFTDCFFNFFTSVWFEVNWCCFLISVKV